MTLSSASSFSLFSFSCKQVLWFGRHNLPVRFSLLAKFGKLPLMHLHLLPSNSCLCRIPNARLVPGEPGAILIIDVSNYYSRQIIFHYLGTLNWDLVLDCIADLLLDWERSLFFPANFGTEKKESNNGDLLHHHDNYYYTITFHVRSILVSI